MYVHTQLGGGVRAQKWSSLWEVASRCGGAHVLEFAYFMDAPLRRRCSAAVLLFSTPVRSLSSSSPPSLSPYITFRSTPYTTSGMFGY